jgi:UDP-glucose 6-dehydrogenase
MKNEADVKKIVKDVLKNTNICCWFMPPANGYGRSGIPDFVGCVNGFMFAVETKFGKGTTTANQEREIQALMMSGAKVWIVRETSVDVWEIEFKAWVALTCL